MSSLIKEINRPVKHLLYYYEKLTFSKLPFYRVENLKKWGEEKFLKGGK